MLRMRACGRFPGPVTIAAKAIDFKRMTDISIILPAYNEAARIAGTVRETVNYCRTKGFVYQIIVAADGNDNTREIALEMSQSDSAIQVIGSAERGGKGRGVREGVELATGAIIGYVDADNKVPIGEFDKFLPELNNGCEVVIGSRGFKESSIGKKQPWYRQVGSKGFYYFMQTVVSLPGIRDTQCGFKFFSHAAAKAIFRHQKIDGYMFDVEILAIARRLGYTILEVPIRWSDDGDSRLSLFAGNLHNARDIFKIRSSISRTVPSGVLAQAGSTCKEN
jgi:dolichyl-phosphate beta-glucosyltransferase